MNKKIFILLFLFIALISMSAVSAADFKINEGFIAFCNASNFLSNDQVLTDKIAEMTKPFLSLGNQYGEGWFLAGEMVELITHGTPNIVCIQPFACLPNHVVGKGVIKALKKAYPQSNIAAVDYDPGASEVNQLNRIKLMLSSAKETLK